MIYNIHRWITSYLQISSSQPSAQDFPPSPTYQTLSIHTFSPIAGLLAEVNTEIDISAAWGIWLGRDSIDGRDVLDEVVDKEMGVMDKKDDGSDIYDYNKTESFVTSNFARLSYKRLSEEGAAYEIPFGRLHSSSIESI